MVLTAQIRRVSSRRWAITWALLLSVYMPIAVVPAASADVFTDCVFTDGALTITLGTEATVAAAAPGSGLGADISLTGSGNCEGSYTNVVTLDITGSSSDDTVSFEEAGDTAWSLVDIDIDLNDSTGDVVVLNGTIDGSTTADTIDAETFATYDEVESIEIYGNDGADNLSGADGLSDTIWGGAGDDYIHGGDGDVSDVLHGGTGNDTFDECEVAPPADTGADDIFGEDGVDTVDYSGRTTPVTVTLDSGPANDGASGEGDDIVTVENVLGGSAADTLTGNSSSNFLSGGGGDWIDILNGLAGNDVLEGGDADTLDGGRGSDTVSYANSDVGVQVALGNQVLVVTISSGGHANGDSLTGFENILGSGYDDTLTGNASANVISGGGGTDILDGGDGNDTIRGGAGDDDAMTGGEGNDTLYGDAGVDDALWNCGDGKDKANFGAEDGYTKAEAKTNSTSCETLAGSFSRN